jgi:hypothetical protein
MAPAALNTAMQIALVLDGVGDVVSQIRQTANQFDGLSGSARSANDAVGQLRAQLTSGASAGQFGGLAAQFRSVGLEASQVPDIASSFREALHRDPLAISAFGRSVLPARMGGPQDETRELREAMRLIRETTNAEERLYTARRLGLEVMLPLADADQRHYQAMEEEGERRGAMVDEELRQLRANRETQRQRFEDLAAERDMIRERISLRFSNWWRDNISLPLQEMQTRFGERLAGAVGLGPASVSSGGGASSHEQALERNTRALATLKDELANSGRRGDAAIPAALKGITLQKALESGKLQTGAFIP